jgi:nucleoside-diphosphate-sugar epimerase
MRLLITGAGTSLCSVLAHALGSSHHVSTLETSDHRSTVGTTLTGDLRDQEFAASVARGFDVVVHMLPPVEQHTDAGWLLDTVTRGTFNLAMATSARRVILLSTLRMFDRYPTWYHVNEYWAPRPTTALADLAPYLAEVTLREVSRVLPLQTVVLRLGDIVAPGATAPGTTSHNALHIDDAVQAVERAIAFEPSADEPGNGWWVFHIPGGGNTRYPLGLAGEASFGYRPQHDLASAAPASYSVGEGGPRKEPSIDQESRDQLPDRSPRRVVVYGAGGPLAAATVDTLVQHHMLRLTDLNPLSDVRGPSPHQRPDVPVPRVLEAPHESWTVDVTNADQVREAARDMDAIINCSVLRHDPVDAFRVNMLGAYNVMRAAVDSGIRRVVHTGPFQAHLPHPAGYGYDTGIVDDVPARPGTNLYILTKFLGQEICRIFAEEHDLEVPALLFCVFVNPSGTWEDRMGLFPFAVSWADAAEAMRLALHVPSLPHPFELFHILADLPHGRYTNEKARRLLNWQPRDDLRQFYTRASETVPRQP